MGFGIGKVSEDYSLRVRDSTRRSHNMVDWVPRLLVRGLSTILEGTLLPDADLFSLRALQSVRVLL